MFDNDWLLRFSLRTTSSEPWNLGRLPGMRLSSKPKINAMSVAFIRALMLYAAESY